MSTVKGSEEEGMVRFLPGWAANASMVAWLWRAFPLGYSHGRGVETIGGFVGAGSGVWWGTEDFQVHYLLVFPPKPDLDLKDPKDTEFGRGYRVGEDGFDEDDEKISLRISEGVPDPWTEEDMEKALMAGALLPASSGNRQVLLCELARLVTGSDPNWGPPSLPNLVWYSKEGQWILQQVGAGEDALFWTFPAEESDPDDALIDAIIFMRENADNSLALLAATGTRSV
jgi:hypothetical protein